MPDGMLDNEGFFELLNNTPKSPITERLISELQGRTKIGYSKYGRVLDKWVGKHPLKNLKEELYDGIQYLEQELIEHEELMLLLGNLFSYTQRPYCTMSPELHQLVADLHQYYLKQLNRTNGGNDD